MKSVTSLLKDYDTPLLVKKTFDLKKKKKRKNIEGIIFVIFKPYQIHLANPLELTQSRRREKL